MEKTLLKCIDKVIEENSIDALYIYGSYVNGYYRRDSDIDVVALTSKNARNRPLEMPPNISVHLIHPYVFQSFETGHPYAHLKMVPVYNKKRCIGISDNLKSELVRRELIRFKKAGIKEFDVLDPLNNYFFWYGAQRPWRIKPIKRVFNSKESQKILKGEYQKILNLLEEKQMIGKRNGKFFINPDYFFDEEFEDPKDEFMFKVKNSCLGWHYLRNMFSIREMAKKRK